jgi:hypothetical protein
LRWGNRGPLQRAKIAFLGRELRQKIERFRPRPAAPDWDGAGPLPDAVKEFLVTAGIQAPSGDNAQPWRFEWRGANLRVSVDAARDPSFFNYRQRASLISLGGVVENIRAVASRYRLAVDAAPDADPLSMTLTFAPGPAPLDPLAEAVWERDTNRRPFNKEPLSANARTALTPRRRPRRPAPGCTSGPTPTDCGRRPTPPTGRTAPGWSSAPPTNTSTA